MKKTILILMVIMALSIALFAQKADKAGKPDNPPMKENCQSCMNKDMDHGKMGMQDMMKDLNLTKEQQTKLDALRDEHMKFMNSKQAELENLQIDKQNAMKAENYTLAKQINKNINDIQLVIDNAMVDHRAAVLKELTPEQKAKMMEMKPMGMGKGMEKCNGMDKDKGPRMHGDKGACKGNCK
jgi:Spy/CpxP family protein refolding chaperone